MNVLDGFLSFYLWITLDHTPWRILNLKNKQTNKQSKKTNKQTKKQTKKQQQQKNNNKQTSFQIVYFFYFVHIGHENFKTLLLLQIAIELVQTFPEYSCQQPEQNLFFYFWNFAFFFFFSFPFI